jgi:hypothetical protein
MADITREAIVERNGTNALYAELVKRGSQDSLGQCKTVVPKLIQLLHGEKKPLKICISSGF